MQSTQLNRDRLLADQIDRAYLEIIPTRTILESYNFV